MRGDAVINLLTWSLTGSNSLTSGSKYWLKLSTAGSGAWFFNNTGASGLVLLAPATTPLTNSLPAFRINGDGAIATPEPGTLALLGLGVLGTVVMRRRRTA